MPRPSLDLEMTIVMPLGVLANQLIKIEMDLRFLSMKAVEFSSEDGANCAKTVGARLEIIREVLDSINALLIRLGSEIHPKQPAMPALREFIADSAHKSQPEWDD